MSITIRTFEDGDEHGVVRLFRDVFGREMTLKEWNWKYRGQGNGIVPSIVMEDDGTGIVGHYGGILLRMVRDGLEIKGASNCDVMIHPKFRSFIRLKKMHNLCIDELVKASVFMIYGFPTEDTLMIPADKLRLYERIEAVQEAVKDVMFGNSPFRFLYELLPLAFDDIRIDRLWDEAKDQFRLAVIRDRKYLSWRYGENPLFSYEIWGLKKRWSGDLLAVAVIKKERSEKLLIMDMVFKKDMLPVLLAKVENMAYSEGKKKLSLWAPRQIRDILWDRGFSFLTTGTTLPRAMHPLTLSKNEVSENFFYTMGDTDYL